MEQTQAPWWQTELYTSPNLLPPVPLTDLAGPLGPAYVQVYPDGRTATGWGQNLFMHKYLKNGFGHRRAVTLFDRHSTPFALVMRSVRMICIDIDGKNGGIDSAKAMLLPPTLAETSKSGNGYHLFYLVDDIWDDRLGFAAFGDRIGFRAGVDVRGTGCVYHYPRQMWNNRQPVLLPEHVLDKLNEQTRSLEQSIARIDAALESDDPLEIMMIQDNIQSRLTAPIPQGKRNNTLFALGAEMNRAQVPGWEQQIHDRAIELGLGVDEISKLLVNIRKYG